MKKAIQNRLDLKNPVKQLIYVLTAFIAVICIGVAGFLQFYNTYIDKILYAERLSQMQEVTAQLFSGLEDVVQNRWESTSVQCNYLYAHAPKDTEELIAFMQQQAALNNFIPSQINVVAVDSKGRYYTQNGLQGTLTEMDYLLNEPEKLSYISNSMTTGETRMVFLSRLDEPVSLQDGSHTVDLIYYGTSQSMEQLNPYFDCSAYDGNNSVYVIDSDGAKLFHSSNADNINGYNAYSVLSTMEYLHGSSFEEARQELSENGIAYSNAVLNGEEYYYSLYRMDNSEWTLLFLVPSASVATNTVILINTTIRLILIFAALIMTISMALIFFILQIKQKQALALEQNANKILDRKNAELYHAVQLAEAAQKEAETSNRAKSDFLANMSHDIRTPMNAIVGITSLMEHEEGVSDKLHGYIQKVQLSSRHLLSLINDILDMSKIESSEILLNHEPISLAEQVGQVDSIIRSQTSERSQTFHISVHEIVHEYLIGDGVRLRQIFLNLLSNAVKYTQNGGTIVFDIAELPCDETGQAKYVFTVSDNGYGMTPEFLEHIFEPFTREESSLTNRVQGTGLGMAITKNIVDLMGGEIRVESSYGRGSTFTVTLTLSIDPSAGYEIGAEHVLLISSDEELIRNMYAPLREVSLNFHAVSTQKDAVRFLSENPVDVILLAGHLRDRTLADTVSLLRKLAKNAVFIFCVDFAQQDQVQETLTHCGVDGLIPRPFFLSNLERAIERVHSNLIPETDEFSILRGMRFLCAEDNELNAEILEALLEMYGASCTIFSNGVEIVQAFADVKPGEYDAILMDVQMPKMNGYDATRKIRNGENPLGKTIPIIAMTANAFSDDIQNSLNAGMDAHISKPIDISLLEKTVKRFSTPPRIFRQVDE